MRLGRRNGLVVLAAVVVGVLAAGWLVWYQTIGSRLVTLDRSGGFAGTHVSVSVFRDGRLHIDGLSRSRGPVRTRLSGDALADLRTALDAADFAHMPSQQIDRKVNDALLYRITYRHWRVLTNTPELVPGLAPVVERLTDLLQQYST
ncbi:MAG TPA: hypothetical protein VL738_10095 [Dactylosporangium sp.]|jgi:hypothetical protein|nr:hypothetical protein [Dactylosporangium sp.]